MTHKNVFAFTALGFEPAYVSLNRHDEDGRLVLSARGKDADDRQVTIGIDLPPEELSQIFIDLARYISVHAPAIPASKRSRKPLRDERWPTRADIEFMSAAELVIFAAGRVTEAEGASIALTHAITLLSLARDRVADHFETTTVAAQ